MQLCIRIYYSKVF